MKLTVINTYFIFSPLEQFEIVSLIPFKNLYFNITLTNISFFMILTFMILTFMIFLSFYKNNLLPSYYQLILEDFYKLTLSIVKDNLSKKGEIYFPFFFALHLFLLMSNLIGMIPYSFTVTSHIIFTFGISLALFIGINLIGLQKHGLNFFSLFLPRGVPLIIVPLIVTIEFLSYLIKVFTLSIRLFANMTSGHTLLKIIAGFSWSMLTIGGFVSFLHIIPLGVLLLLIGLELAIAILQAYVFTLLTCIYLNDVLELH